MKLSLLTQTVAPRATRTYYAAQWHYGEGVTTTARPMINGRRVETVIDACHVYAFHTAAARAAWINAGPAWRQSGGYRSTLAAGHAKKILRVYGHELIEVEPGILVGEDPNCPRDAFLDPEEYSY